MVARDFGLGASELSATDSDAVLAIATQVGFSISADDLKKAQLEVSNEKLEDLASG